MFEKKKKKKKGKEKYVYNGNAHGLSVNGLIVIPRVFLLTVVLVGIKKKTQQDYFFTLSMGFVSGLVKVRIFHEDERLDRQQNLVAT